MDEHDSLQYGESHRERMGRKSREASKKVAEIGPLPAVVNPERKEACRFDLLLYSQTYFPNSTGLSPFSDDHKQMIAYLQRCILFGGMVARAVYRGFAKTSIGEVACIWAGSYGHRKFVMLIGADADAVQENLESIKSEIETNDLLMEDFPEVCHPVRALDGRHQRAATQTVDGKRTRLGWTANKIVFPTIEGADSSGVCIRPESLLACPRGLKHKTAEGHQVRPDFVFIDDPQTNESAASPSQTAKRLDAINRTILKLAGHSKQIAAYMAATVIEKDDLVDQILDVTRNPQWQSERVKMVKSWSKAHETLWLGQYAEILHNYDRQNPDAKREAERKATQFYDENRAAMDEGCVVSWENIGLQETEISAIQHAYNMLIRDGAEVFASECQNEPPNRNATASAVLEPSSVQARGIGALHKIVPHWATHLTAFIDVQANILWYAVAAWADDFTGQIIDYGAWPDQGRAYFSKADAKKTMAQMLKGAAAEAQLWHGLETLTANLLGSKWKHESGEPMDIDLCLIDEGYMTPTVFEFCRRCSWGSRIMPAKGAAIGARSKPFEEYKRVSGETLGTHWRRVKVGGNNIRHIIHDPNYWKSFIWNRLRVPPGTKGALTLYKAQPSAHRMVADHIAASEFPVLMTNEANGRSVEEWQQRPGRDNDLLDCISGTAIGASILGCKLDADVEGKTPGRKKKRRKATGAWAA